VSFHQFLRRRFLIGGRGGSVAIGVMEVPDIMTGCPKKVVTFGGSDGGGVGMVECTGRALAGGGFFGSVIARA